MAKIYSDYNNYNDFLVIEMNGHEASSLNFGFKIPGDLNIIICGSCNSEIQNKNIYYVAGINEVMCKDCVDDFIKNTTHYTDEDSLRYEVNHFNLIASKLGIEEKADFNSQGTIFLTK